MNNERGPAQPEHGPVLSSYLSDILVAHSADLLDVCRGLGDSLEGVAGQDELILLGLGDLDVDTLLHEDSADELLTNKVAAHSNKSASCSRQPNNRFRCVIPLRNTASKRIGTEANIPDLDLEDTLGSFVQVDVDGEMGVDVSHLVLETLGDTDDQVVDKSSDSAEGGDILADAVVDVDGDGVGLGLGEADGDVGQVLDQLAAGALDGDLASLDVHLDCLQEKDFGQRFDQNREAMKPYIASPVLQCPPAQPVQSYLPLVPLANGASYLSRFPFPA